MLNILTQDTWVGMITYIVLFSSWFFISIMYELIGYFPYFDKYKIQKNNVISKELKHLAIYMCTINWGLILIATYLGASHINQLFPNKTFVWIDTYKIPISLVIDDIFFYTYHRTLHSNKFLYQFHKPHHKFSTPFVWTSHAVHPVELFLQSIGGMLGPIITNMSLPMLWLWFIVRQAHGVIEHSGYDSWLDPLGWVPFMAGTKFHDDHHKRILGNYASTFSIIDKFCNTILN